MKFLKILILSVMALPVAAFAGNGGVNGNDKLARLLNYAHDVEVPAIIGTVSPSDPAFDNVVVREKYDGGVRVVSLREKYRDVRKSFISDLSQLPLKATDKVKDATLGYHTWIGIDLDQHTILYASGKYQEVVMIAPTNLAMQEALIHEVGHFYSLDEDGCVT